MRYPQFVDGELRRLEAEGRLRVAGSAAERGRWEQRAASKGRPLLDFCSNDYLGWATRSVSRETLGALLEDVATGAGASRLIYGSHVEHDRLEAELAAWLGFPAVLLFSSGYAANIGILSALAGPGDLVVSDTLNHASIIDGCRLSRAEVAVVPHLDLAATDRALARPAARRFLVTEAYFSMDGDGPDLAATAHIAAAHDAVWILDEAHSLGVFGPSGRGLAAAAAVEPDLLVGTLGKAFGLHGAFVATTPAVRTLLWNRARSFVYSTATSPLLAALTRARLAAVQEADPARAHLAQLAHHARDRVANLALRTPADRDGPILPVLLGDSPRAEHVATALREDGFLAQAIRPPTVPQGTARLRVVLHANHSLSDVDAFFQTLGVALAALPPRPAP